MKPTAIVCCLIMTFLMPMKSGLAQKSAPMSCTESPISVPFTFPFKCNNLGSDGGNSGNCGFENFNATGADSSREFLAFAKKTAAALRTRCYVMSGDIAADLRGVDPFTRQNGSDFGGVETFGDGHTATFTGKGDSGPINCFSFVKYGPRLLGGYDNFVRGHVCNRDGSKVTDDEMQQFIRAVGVR